MYSHCFHIINLSLQHHLYRSFPTWMVVDHYITNQPLSTKIDHNNEKGYFRNKTIHTVKKHPILGENSVSFFRKMIMNYDFWLLTYDTSSKIPRGEFCYKTKVVKIAFVTCNIKVKITSSFCSFVDLCILLHVITCQHYFFFYTNTSNENKITDVSILNFSPLFTH